MTAPRSAFALPDRLAAKGDPTLIAADERQFAAIEQNLARSITELSARLDRERRAPGRQGQEALERDLEIHRLTARLRGLRRFGLDLCLGRMVIAGQPEPVYIGRFGLSDAEGRRLLIDWRSPAAEPFFGATRAQPMGVLTRRRYRWTRGRITDYWDEAFTREGLAESAALDDESAFIASLGSSRSERMRDVLGTIQADQDAIIRAPSPGTLVIDGGPGTGKTVVALHRTAYLLYADPRLRDPGRGVLFVGPHEAYLSYVEDVLPDLGEEGVQNCTLRDLVAEGAGAAPELDPEVAELKARGDLERMIELAVSGYEVSPPRAVTVETPWADIRLGPEIWSDAFASAEPGSPHNEAREQIWEELLAIAADEITEGMTDGMADGLDEEVPPDQLRRALLQSEELRTAFARAWPLLDPVGVVADLLSVPSYLARCAPWLSADERRALHRDDSRAWTIADLPLLDAARHRIGDPDASRRRRRRAAALASERQERARVVEHLIESDDSELQLMSMLRGQDLENSLIDEAALPGEPLDLLAGPFAHVVVDEAQELSDAEWQMLVRRCPSRSFTIVGDRAQARRGFSESWSDRLTRIGLDRLSVASLSINYRTPSEIMAEAEPVIHAVLPTANVPTSVRSTGMPVRHGSRSERQEILENWLAAHPEGIACVIGDADFVGSGRVRSLRPEVAKGLEFDLVILMDPEHFGEVVAGAVDRYVAMTRATQQLVILSSGRETVGDPVSG